ncbi:hypothetical protein [Clostridium sp. 001]|nr:hypothetical protein [Clostridium sp. 001]
MALEVKLIEYTTNLFMNCGPSCVNGSCLEGKMTCGKLQEI